MKIRSVTVNNRKRQIELTLQSGKILPVPFAQLDPQPTPEDRVVQAYVDRELANEAATYILESGAEGSVHVDHALECNRDPGYLAEILIHKLSVEALRHVDQSGLSRRELARRLSTSVPQLYRLLDPANTRKSLGQLVALLHLLGCDVELVIHPRHAA
ncbi:MAG: helix-turn-helix domain-containing protein [Thermoanaerobaculia bacterium]